MKVTLVKSVSGKHLEWREKWKPEYLRDEWKVPEVLQKYTSLGFLGFDFKGSPGEHDRSVTISAINDEIADDKEEYKTVFMMESHKHVDTILLNESRHKMIITSH